MITKKKIALIYHFFSLFLMWISSAVMILSLAKKNRFSFPFAFVFILRYRVVIILQKQIFRFIHRNIENINCL